MNWHERAKRANRHPCDGGCGTLVSGRRKYCPVCSCRVIQERKNAYHREQTRARQAVREGR